MVKHVRFIAQVLGFGLFKVIVLGSGLGLPAQAESLNPQSTCRMTEYQAEALAAHVDRIEQFSPEKRVKALQQILLKDQTNRHPYHEDWNSSSWFVCHHYSTQMYLRTSLFAESSKHDLSQYELNTPIRFQKDQLSPVEKLPILYVGLTNKDHQFYHAINALFVGTRVDQMSDLNFYVFFEPQTDQIFFSVKHMLDAYLWNRSSTSVTEISLSHDLYLQESTPRFFQYFSSTFLKASCL